MPRFGPKARRRMLTALLLAIGASVIVIALASANNVGGFEIDADHTTASDALYSGNNAGDDWAQGTSNQGIFAPSAAAPHTAAADCYGSNIDKNTNAGGVSALICDGNSDTKFKASEPEQNIVSPSGKSPDDVWPIKPGNVRPKNDFSHAYVHASVVDSPCDSDTDADDVVLHLAGHVGDNEGSHFWGFEFMKNQPTGFDSLKANDGSSFNLDFNRQVGDILVSFTVPGNTSEPVQLELFRVSGFSGTSAVFTQAGALAGCPAGQPQGFSLLTTNNFNDVKAPPWNVPACDPTADNGSNSCRLANGNTPAEDLLPPRDFAEASVDLTAFGISPCFTNVVFSSRSSHVLDGADVQDVGGTDFPLCGKKSGTKFHDHNANGVRDTGDEGLPNWQIKLYRDDGDKVLEDSDDGTTGNGAVALSTATTNAQGAYEFPNLANGNYIVCEVKQSGWNESLPNSGTSDKADCGVDSTLGAVGRGFTMAGADHTGNDFGNYQNGTKSGTKFEDTNGNGVRNTGEPGLSGVQIHLFGTDGLGNAVHLHATTDANGNYSISAPPGSYTACETVPAGYTQSFPTSGPSCSAHTGQSTFGYTVTLTSNGTDSGNDFGNFRNVTISGLKFKDADAGGDKDSGEIGLGGWEIHVFGTDGRGNAVHNHTTTAADGTYSFTVAPGTYTICETVSGKTGWVESFPSSGTSCTAHTHSGAITPGPFGHSVTATSGGTFGDRDFGNTPLSRVNVSFESLADLPNGSDATKATAISCTDKNGAAIGSNTNSNTLTTSSVKTNQSSLTCTITFVDP
jgi:SdrD B-like protein